MEGTILPHIVIPIDIKDLSLGPFMALESHIRVNTNPSGHPNSRHYTHLIFCLFTLQRVRRAPCGAVPFGRRDGKASLVVMLVVEE